MFETTAVDNVANRYVDKDVGGGTPGTRLEEADRNIIQDELTKPVTSSGQALDPTGAIRDQVTRAVFIYGTAAQSLVDTGGAGAYVVDHVSASFVVPTAFAEIDGAMAVFIPAVINAGASTLDYMGLGPKPITDGAGVALAGGEMSGYVMLEYNLTSDRWEVVFAKFTDAVHGSRLGGSLHALAVAGVSAGFLSAADKTKLDSITPGGEQFVTNAINQTGSRSLGVNYTNTTGRAMLVVVQVSGIFSSNSGTVTALLGGVVIQTADALNRTIGAGNDYSSNGSLIFVVPAGIVYRVNTSANNTIRGWSEMD